VQHCEQLEGATRALRSALEHGLRVPASGWPLLWVVGAEVVQGLQEVSPVIASLPDCKRCCAKSDRRMREFCAECFHGDSWVSQCKRQKKEKKQIPCY